MFPTVIDLPPKVRRVCYVAAAFLGLAFAAVQAWYFAMGIQTPREVSAAEAVAGVLVAGLGVMAAGNTPRSAEAQAAQRAEDDAQAEGRRYYDEDGDGRPDETP